MSDLISRQAAIDALCKAGCGSKHCGVSCDDVSAIEQLPVAQPERKKGEWIDNETSYADGVVQTCNCSECGRRSPRPLGDFCRWCGADMRGEQDG